MTTKGDILDKIKKKVQRKKDLSEEIAQRNKNVEAFILKQLDELDSVMMSTVNTSLLDTPNFREYYVDSVESRIRSLDNDAKVEVSWNTDERTPGIRPHVNGVLIKWSKKYQKEHNCEEQLFVDIFTSLLK